MGGWEEMDCNALCKDWAVLEEADAFQDKAAPGTASAFVPKLFELSQNFWDLTKRLFGEQNAEKHSERVVSSGPKDKTT